MTTTVDLLKRMGETHKASTPEKKNHKHLRDAKSNQVAKGQQCQGREWRERQLELMGIAVMLWEPREVEIS